MTDDIFETLEGLNEGFTTLDPEPAPAPEPEPDPAPPPEPDPEPEAPAGPVEVITVDDLLDRITGGDQSAGETGDEETEAPPQEEEGTPLPGGDTELPPAEGALEGPIEVVGMDVVLERLEALQGVAEHPMMETPFEDYTVTEGLLLLLLLSVFVSACVKLLKGGFAWLR